jgi:Glyoxalase superfamily protein
MRYDPGSRRPSWPARRSDRFHYRDVVADDLVPVFRVEDGRAAASWYERLGFVVVGEHRFAPDLPLYLFVRRGEVSLHLSEHAGDAPPGSLAYFYVDDFDVIAEDFGAAIADQPWGREIELTDPSGNRLRIGSVPTHP